MLDKVRERLLGVSDTAFLDSQVLMAHVLGRARSWIIAHPEAILTTQQVNELEIALERLENREPLPFVLGHWEFYGLDFTVTPAVLIPRPETEHLVEQALDWLESHPGRRLAADVGTGSGCIAVALAKNATDLEVMACDISLEALRIARQNVRIHGLVNRVHCVQSDLVPGISNRVAGSKNLDLICANLPYVPTKILAGLPVSRREPVQALDGGPDGLRIIRRLLVVAPAILALPGLLLIEIEASQGAAVKSMAETAFPLGESSVLQDLAGNDRLVCVCQ